MPVSLDIERLYDEHAQPLYALLLNCMRNEMDTRDLLQEIFVKLAREPRLLDGDARTVRLFSFSQARNAVIDFIHGDAARSTRTPGKFCRREHLSLRFR